MKKPDSRSLARAALAVSVILTAALVGLLAGVVAEGSLLSLLVLIGEPLIGFALLAAALYATLARRWGRAALAVVALVALGWGLRQPRAPVVEHETPQAIGPVVRTCASVLGQARGPARVATWNTGGERDPERLAQAVAALDADVTVLQELRGQALMDALVERVQRDLETSAGPLASADEPSATPAEDPIAEGIWVEAMAGAGLGILVRRGWFGVCGQEQTDRWVLPMPAAGDRSAQAVLTFPMIRGVGTVPVVGLHLDRPAGPSELMGWGERIRGSAKLLAGTGRALSTPSLVLAGDTNTHSTFRLLSTRLRGVGLNPVPARATWPAALGPLPWVPVYTLDRLWHGEGWRLSGVRTLRVQRGADHLAVAADLEPALAP